MSTGSTDSDENPVSDGAALPEHPSTDSLADLPASENTDDAEGRDAAEDFASNDVDDCGDCDDRDDADGKRYILEPYPCKNSPIGEQMRIGRLMLEVDNLEFAYGMQRGLEFASKDSAWRDYDGTPTISMQELQDKMLKQLEEGQATGYADAIGQLFGEICYLLLGTTRMQVLFKRRCRLVWK
jgi:hypothetical protein